MIKVYRNGGFGKWEDAEKQGRVTLQTLKASGGDIGGGTENLVVEKNACHIDNGNQKAILIEPEYIVRRLTPLELCRLQGFPDYWTDGVEGSDSAKYKMWGNGVAYFCVAFVLDGIAEELKKEDDMK